MIKFNGMNNGDAKDIFKKIGEVPLPPYIKRDGKPTSEDGERYQAVYAKKEGSVAAPTAGLHFTQELIEQMKEKGIAFAEVTLHIGPGTFRPIKGDVPGHKMEEEYFEADKAAIGSIIRTRRTGGRVIAVGTSVVRVLETLAGMPDFSSCLEGSPCTGKEFCGWTKLYICPGYEFKVIDGLITNFHLPFSTPFVLTCTFGGIELMHSAYSEAIDKGYRFLSFGDAMLII